MSGGKHTPGPWTNARTVAGRLVWFHVTPQAAGACSPPEPADPEAVANMQLLDAAPDMARALRAILAAVDADATHNSLRELIADYRALVQGLPLERAA